MSPDRLCPLRPSNQQLTTVITLFASQLPPCHQSPVQRGSRKLITTVNCEHQQSEPRSPTPPTRRPPGKVLIQDGGREQPVVEFTSSRLSITLTAQ
ncbi:hypothetical protein EYF80_025197 [Liparis tanakae]|uniref:Uncharacterized protein n=1 Tax=Liparis tanakae TaxID=230148 RepID=A0A4Z2HGA8_9TELE|nr:hypothetical protein EYF80_025197 [Liparis tanakae]